PRRARTGAARPGQPTLPNGQRRHHGPRRRLLRRRRGDALAAVGRDGAGPGPAAGAAVVGQPGHAPRPGVQLVVTRRARRGETRWTSKSAVRRTTGACGSRPTPG